MMPSSRRASLSRSRSCNSDLRSVGCKLVPNNTWPSAPLEVPIIGLKELPEST
jgi:hypothetical protein